MKRNTIVYIGGFKLPDKNAAAQRVINNAKILRNLGFKVVLLGVSDDLSKNDNPLLKVYDGFETISFGYPQGIKHWLEFTLGQQAMVDAIRKYSASLHSVICYNFPARASSKFFKFAHQSGGTTISDITEWYDTNLKSPRGIVKAMDTYARMKYVGPQSDAIITTSTFMLDYYSKSGKPQVNLPTLYDVSKIKDYGETYPGASSKRTFVYAGSPGVTSGKNVGFTKDRLDLVVEALSKVKDTKNTFVLKVYGLDEKNYRDSMPSHNSIIDSLGDKIEFLGRRPHMEILKAFTEADYTTFIRTEDRLTLAGFPSKFAESVSCGTPVICSAVANLNTYMSEGENSFEVHPDDMASAAIIFQKCIDLPSEELNRIHAFCTYSEQFDYRNFEPQVKVFVDEISNRYNLD